jgi:regulator of sigma E protease
LEKRDNEQHDPVNRLPGGSPNNSPNGQPNSAPNDAPAGAANGDTSEGGIEELHEPTIGQWLASNGFALIVVAAAIGYVLWKFDAEGIWAIIKALIGLSFVIFIHELGHFLAAKWCDVNVTTFSIGFGPVIPGCWFKWGETIYKLALFPLGGYVQMVGQVDGDEASDGSEDDPRSFRNKTVGQRMLIISAGVIMNVVLAIACFIIVYQGAGKDRTAAVIGSVEADSPAYQAGVRPGMQVLQIGETKDPVFEDLLVAVVFTDHGEKVRFVGKRPGDETALDVMLEPRLEASDTRPIIGVGPSNSLEMVDRRLLGSGRPRPAVYDSPADRASGPPFEYGDRVIATTDPDDPSKITELPMDPRSQERPQRDYFEFTRRMERLAGKDVVIRVRRAGREDTADIHVRPAFHQSLGVRMQMGEIAAIRNGSPAEKAGLRAPDKVKKLEGDLIVGVGVPQSWADGNVKYKTLFDEKNLDPERLPHQLRHWFGQSENSQAPRKLQLHVRRHREPDGGQQYEKKTIEVDWDEGWRFDKEVPLREKSPFALPELGLAYHIKPVVAGVLDGHIENNPLKAGDNLKQIRIEIYGDGAEHDGRPTTVEFDKANWAYVWYLLNHGRFGNSTPVKNIKLTVQRDKETIEVELTPVADEAWPLAERGLIFSSDERRQKADGITDAVALGLKDTHKSMMQVVHTLGGMFKGRLSVKNLGGPITIATTAYSIAGYDFWEFVFFLGLISINLAVINFLPIPVLDGGHMVFLIYEKLRGKPASENVRVGATYAGLAIILTLMVFVIWLDIGRF